MRGGWLMRKTKVNRFDRRAIGSPQQQAKIVYRVKFTDPLTTRARALAETADAIFESLPKPPLITEDTLIKPLTGDGFVDWLDLVSRQDSYRLTAASNMNMLIKDYYFNADKFSRIAYLQRNFEELTGYYLEAVDTLNQRAEATLDAEKLRSHRLRMEELQADFDKLEQGLKRVTPVHEALQHHIGMLVTFLPTERWRSPQAEKRFFEPLTDLRDEYFAGGELRLIEEYRRLSSPKAGGVEYAVAYGSPLGNGVELAAEELEIAAMLESLYEAR
jgi:hypothetical protein